MRPSEFLEAKETFGKGEEGQDRRRESMKAERGPGASRAPTPLPAVRVRKASPEQGGELPSGPSRTAAVQDPVSQAAG